MMERRPSPCPECIRVKEPAECDNKNCKLWQRWFLAQWEQTRRDLGKALCPEKGDTHELEAGSH